MYMVIIAIFMNRRNFFFFRWFPSFLPELMKKFLFRVCFGSDCLCVCVCCAWDVFFCLCRFRSLRFGCYTKCFNHLFIYLHNSFSLCLISSFLSLFLSLRLIILRLECYYRTVVTICGVLFELRFLGPIQNIHTKHIYYYYIRGCSLMTYKNVYDLCVHFICSTTNFKEDDTSEMPMTSLRVLLLVVIELHQKSAVWIASQFFFSRLVFRIIFFSVFFLIIVLFFCSSFVGLFSGRHSKY